MPEQEIKEVETTETEAARFPVGAALGAAVGTEATPPNDTEEAEVTVIENEPISVEQYRALLVLGARDARTYADQVDSLIAEIDAGKKVKGTKLNGTVRNLRLEILRSSLTDIKTAKVIG
jgi:hypothetical protein